MSRSRKKPYYKDRGLTTHEYWSVVRHEWKQKLNENYYKDDFYLRNPKSMINDWDYSDYSFWIKADPDGNKKDFWTHFMGWTEEDEKRASRK